MLVIFYIVSAIGSIFTSKFAEQGKFKQLIIAVIVTIITGLALCLPIVNNMIDNMADVSFWSVFAVISLVVWHCTIIFDDKQNFFNYQVIAAFLACMIWLIGSIFFSSEVLEPCNTIHVSTETISILTTKDNSKFGKTVYGDGYIILKISSDTNSENSVYRYYYQRENGTIIQTEIMAKYTEVVYIASDEVPYVEIVTTRDCNGYSPKTSHHSLGLAHRTYTLYVPEGTILNVLQTDEN